MILGQNIKNRPRRPCARLTLTLLTIAGADANTQNILTNQAKGQDPSDRAGAPKALARGWKKRAKQMVQRKPKEINQQIKIFNKK